MVHISRKILDDARKIAIIREKYRMNENSEISLEKMENISGMSKQDIIIAMEADKNASSIENESVLDYLDQQLKDFKIIRKCRRLFLCQGYGYENNFPF